MRWICAARTFWQRLAVVCACGALAAVLVLVLPWSYRCPVSTFLHFPCPGCGMTRAARLLLQLDLRGAFVAHPMVYGVLGYGAVLVYAYLFDKMYIVRSRVYVWSFCIAMLAVWVIRLCAGWLPAV